MEILIFLGGMIVGFIITTIYKNQKNARERIHGIVHIDHSTEQCIFSVTSSELTNRDKKIAVFVINHDANISREEQGL